MSACRKLIASPLPVSLAGKASVKSRRKNLSEKCCPTTAKFRSLTAFTALFKMAILACESFVFVSADQLKYIPRMYHRPDPPKQTMFWSECFSFLHCLLTRYNWVLAPGLVLSVPRWFAARASRVNFLCSCMTGVQPNSENLLHSSCHKSL